MNNNQKRAIDIALKGHNILLLGSAGTGKSFVISEIAKRLSREGKCVKITCSTGIACSVFSQEKACTIHQFTGISDGRFGADEIVNVIKNNRRYDYVVENLRQVDTLIVDEVSMISQKVFETINAVCCMKDPSSEFGGIQVIFCGDFFHLPFVANRHYDDSGKYCFESQLFNSVFPHRVVLTVNIRQRDEDLVKAVNEIYSGNLSPECEYFIRNCKRSLDLPPGQRSIKLFARNKYVDDYNRKCLLDFPGSIYEFVSLDSGTEKDNNHTIMMINYNNFKE